MNKTVGDFNVSITGGYAMIEERGCAPAVGARVIQVFGEQIYDLEYLIECIIRHWEDHNVI